MEKSIKPSLKRWNRLIKQQDEFYHKWSKKCGLADAQFWVLYALCETENSLCQNNFCETWCYSKQTVNSAVKTLIKNELITLDFVDGSRKQKALKLTEKGEQFCDLHVRTLQKIEEDVIESLNEQEREVFLKLYARLLNGLSASL